ncbi:GNAT family N-acetyltransferase [Pseudarthrobacter sp. N5]|uniref:GNAT family N-acetyltransferase n=1 Tax=Pseudarthrobacter sp. N5 TaxID=3418416 RepID=UPI003CF80BED
MSPFVTLAASTGPHEPGSAALPRPIAATDLPELTRLILHADTTGTAHPGTADPANRLSAHFTGGHGTLIRDATLLATDAQGRITAAIVVTERAFGAGGHRTAFIAELFTHPEHRRQGLAENLLRTAMHNLHAKGRDTVAVTLDSSNAAAMALYLAMDFRRWSRQTADG